MEVSFAAAAPKALEFYHVAISSQCQLFLLAFVEASFDETKLYLNFDLFLLLLRNLRSQ